MTIAMVLSIFLCSPSYGVSEVHRVKLDNSTYQQDQVLQDDIIKNNSVKKISSQKVNLTPIIMLLLNSKNHTTPQP